MGGGAPDRAAASLAQLDPQEIPDFLFTLLPALATVAAVALGLALARYLLIGRNQAHRADGRVGRQLAMLGLTVVGVVAIILSLPIGATRQGQLLSLLGLLLSGAIALSSTNLLGNVMSGLMLRAVRGFRPGDFIEVGAEFGRVSERGLLHVEIQTPLREFTTLPNTYLVNNPVRVIDSSGTVVDARVSLGYDVPRRRIEELLCEAAEEAGLEEPFARVLELGDYSVTYQVAGLLRDVEKLLPARSRVRGRILDTLHGAGIEIVSPAFINERAIASGRDFVPRERPPRGGAEPERDEAPAEVFDKASAAALRQRLEDVKGRLEAQIGELERRQREGEAPEEGESLEQQMERARRHLARVEVALEEREPEA